MEGLAGKSAETGALMSGLCAPYWCASRGLTIDGVWPVLGPFSADNGAFLMHVIDSDAAGSVALDNKSNLKQWFMTCFGLWQVNC